MGVRKSRKAALKKRYSSRKRGGGRFHNITQIPVNEWKALDEWLDRMPDNDKDIIKKFEEDYIKHYKLTMDKDLDYQLKIMFYKYKLRRRNDRDHEAQFILDSVYAVKDTAHVKKMSLWNAIIAANKLNFNDDY